MRTLNMMLTGESSNSKLKKNFAWGVFIQIGGTIERLKEYVRERSFNKNIWCMVLDDNVTQLTIERIGDMMKNQ